MLCAPGGVNYENWSGHSNLQLRLDNVIGAIANNMMKTISIINQPINNRGDQAAHKSFVKLLSDNGFDVNVLFIGNKENYYPFCKGISGAKYQYFAKRVRGIGTILKQLSRYPALFKLSRFLPGYKDFMQHIRESDLVVCAPGGVCMGPYKSWSHLINLDIALSNNGNVAIWGRSIGPFIDKTPSDKLFFEKSKEILRQVGFISLRDLSSQNILSSMGLDYIPTLDTAFANTPEVDLPQELSYLQDEKYIVFVPNELYAWHPIFKKTNHQKMDSLYLDIARKITSLGYKIVMLPQLFNRGTKGDYYYFRNLESQSDLPGIKVISEEFDCDIQQAIIRNAKAVVGARYHSIIFAINNLIPFLCLSYEQKMHYTLRMLHLDSYSVDLKDIVENNKKDVVYAKIESIIEQNEQIRTVLHKQRDVARNILSDAFDEFLKYSSNI